MAEMPGTRVCVVGHMNCVGLICMYDEFARVILPFFLGLTRLKFAWL
jgi:hypothetical protein